MSNKPPFCAWHYVTFLPTGFALLGSIIAITSYLQQWGDDPRISTVITVFVCEILMVISAFGILAYIKQPYKRRYARQVFGLNIMYMLSAVFTGLYLFLS